MLLMLFLSETPLSVCNKVVYFIILYQIVYFQLIKTKTTPPILLGWYIIFIFQIQG